MTDGPEILRLDTPQATEFLRIHQLPPPTQPGQSLDDYWQALPWQQQELGGWTAESLRSGLLDYLHARQQSAPAASSLRRLDILAGRAKDGSPERADLVLRPGEVICIVGPTGAGKSRLLGDIECLAQRDTPSRRRILINGSPPDAEQRFSGETRIVAQITQNMNFVMDLSVLEFLELHADSRGLGDTRPAALRVLEAAVGMAGEPFAADTPLTQLSGGQSRALMIADAALLSPKPVVLIDEIENAGVDRTQALQLFIDKGKIVLLSTHDPLLALSGNRRLVIRNGAVAQVIENSPAERDCLQHLRRLDQGLAELRHALRQGASLDQHWPQFFAHHAS